MKREEALKNIKHNIGTYVEQDFFINEIYDDFENQVCENCKYFNEATKHTQSYKDEEHSCNEGVCEYVEYQGDNTYITRKFSCNKFQPKT